MSRHANSTAALHAADADGTLGERAARILAHARNHHGELTDRACAKDLGFADLNAVRPRITELVDAGLLIETGSIRCPISGKKVRTWRAAYIAEINRAQEAARMPASDGVQLDLF